jgi:hypothetical protein
MTSEVLTFWSAYGSFALYLCAILLQISCGLSTRRLELVKYLWTAACTLMMIHIAAAFHGYHSWSHRAAYDHVANRTREVMGLDWGGGLYANYALGVIWTADVIWLWSGANNYRSRARCITWSIHGFLAFMWLNATVVFGSDAISWIGLTAILVIVVCLIAHYRHRF